MFARADIDAQTRDSADIEIDANNEDADLPLRTTAYGDLDESSDDDSSDSSDDEL